MASATKTMTPGTPQGRKRKIDYKPLEVDVVKVEKLRVSNQILNTEDDGGLNFNRNWKNIVKFSNKVVKNVYIQGLMGLMSLFSLYAADIAILVNGDEEIYAGFELGLTIAFFVFLTEIVLTSVANRQYFTLPTSLVWDEANETYFGSLKRRLSFGSFYFFLEFLGVMTILIDLSWAVGDVNHADVGVQVADRAGSAGRIVRLMRVMRFFNFDMHVNNAIAALKNMLRWLSNDRSVTARDDVKKEKEPKPDRGVRFEFGDEQKEEPTTEKGPDGDGSALNNETNVVADIESNSKRSRNTSMKKRGSDAAESEDLKTDSTYSSIQGATTKKMTDLVHRAIISVVVVMLTIIPLLSFNDPDHSFTVTSNMVHVAAYKTYQMSGSSAYTNILNIYTIISMQAVPYLEPQVRSEKPKLPLMEVAFNPAITYNGGSLSLWSNSSYNDVYVRQVDRITIVKETNDFTTTLIFDNRSEVSDHAQQSAITTSFVLTLLFFGTYFFSQTVNKLVIDPINTMVALVTKISENPLGVDYDKEHGAEDGFLDGMETTTLLNTINKIGSLMRVGFGEAGASIIADNLKNSLGARLNLMTAGRMIHSIFGFCDVRQFTDTTECLQEEVMLFVNRIAHILHSIVTQCSGSANKNIGDAFLLTWKLEDDMTADDQAFLADQALLFFCKALVELSRYQDFICNFSKAANERLYTRFPGYNVRIGSGLHVGWAIEGAIGSNRKIDASYLSPHVNFTEYLESSTKAYGVPLLISEQFYNLLSDEVILYVRKVDRVRTNPAEAPVALYTYDADLSLKWPKKALKKPKRHSSALRVDVNNSRRPTLSQSAKANDEDNLHNKGKKRRQSLHSQLKEDTTSNADLKGGIDIETGDGEPKEELPEIVVKPYDFDVWEKDPELIQLRHLAYDNPKFRPLWDNGVDAYIAGDWPTAHHILNDCLEITNDKCGPCKFLLKEIAANGGIAPDDWDGYRIDF